MICAKFAKSDFSLFQLTNDIRQEIHKKLSKACGDTLFCDISDMEAVCSDILDDTNSISRVKRQTQQRRRRLRKNGKNRNRRIKILFKMLGKSSVCHNALCSRNFQNVKLRPDYVKI